VHVPPPLAATCQLRSITERRTDYLYPELNLIEIVWKHAKYHWRRFVTWTKETIDAEIAKLLAGYGSEFEIRFA
jgi:transposase